MFVCFVFVENFFLLLEYRKQMNEQEVQEFLENKNFHLKS